MSRPAILEKNNIAYYAYHSIKEKDFNKVVQ